MGNMSNRSVGDANHNNEMGTSRSCWSKGQSYLRYYCSSLESNQSTEARQVQKPTNRPLLEESNTQAGERTSRSDQGELTAQLPTALDYAMAFYKSMMR